VDGAQQSAVIKILVVIIKSNPVSLFVGGNESQLLLYADLVTIRNSECTAIYGNTILDSIVCAESGTAVLKNICTGDGGAALVLDVETDPVHVGLVSFFGGGSCESGYPFGSTRTASFRIWIRDETGV
jgi:secreted trypsin-like serine protease